MAQELVHCYESFLPMGVRPRNAERFHGAEGLGLVGEQRLQAFQDANVEQVAPHASVDADKTHGLVGVQQVDIVVLTS